MLVFLIRLNDCSFNRVIIFRYCLYLVYKLADFVRVLFRKSLSLTAILALIPRVIHGFERNFFSFLDNFRNGIYLSISACYEDIRCSVWLFTDCAVWHSYSRLFINVFKSLLKFSTSDFFKAFFLLYITFCLEESINLASKIFAIVEKWSDIPDVTICAFTLSVWMFEYMWSTQLISHLFFLLFVLAYQWTTNILRFVYRVYNL